MGKIFFNSIIDVLEEIKKRNYDRNFSSVVGFEFAFDENNDLIFNNLDDYSFFFHFLDVEQFDLSNEKYISVIDKLLVLKDLNPFNIKRILYEDQLIVIEEKFANNLISKEVYNKLINKFLS